MLNQLIMGTLESYFQFKEGVKSGDDEMLMGGLMEIEKIFFFKKSNRNYQQSAAYRAGDIIKMPKEMIEKRIRYQTTSATAFNSITIPGEEPTHTESFDDVQEIQESIASDFEKKVKHPIKQGNDAALEQIIKRSKKAAKITNMDKKGWNVEFRTMSSNIALRKKLDRDLGKLSNSVGDHIRRNLSEIVMVEVLLKNSGWMERPDLPRNIFTNLSGDADLCEDLVQFWGLCGLNRDKGVKQLLEKKVVDFEDICALKDDKDDSVKDIKAMLEEIPKMMNQIPESNPLKMFLLEHFDLEIRGNKSIPTVSNFYENLKQIVNDIENDDGDTEPVEDIEDGTPKE